MDFVSKNKEFDVIDIYCDNGCSGINFSRLQWKRLMEDVKAKKINCIIVKDLSRLGRNYTDTGLYLEHIFPILGIRFISVCDGYDSFDADFEMTSLIWPLKNIINGFYSKDLSEKIKQARHMQRKRGEFTGSRVAYGYKKDKMNKGKLIIDEERAEVVRKIFEYIQLGYSFSKIANILNKHNIPSPSGKSWTVATIKFISKNPVYTGILVQGRSCKDEKETVIIHNAHKAIIEKEIFLALQKSDILI